MFIQQGFAYLPLGMAVPLFRNSDGFMLFFRVQGGHNS